MLHINSLSTKTRDKIFHLPGLLFTITQFLSCSDLIKFLYIEKNEDMRNTFYSVMRGKENQLTFENNFFNERLKLLYSLEAKTEEKIFSLASSTIYKGLFQRQFPSTKIKKAIEIRAENEAKEMILRLSRMGAQKNNHLILVDDQKIVTIPSDNIQPLLEPLIRRLDEDMAPRSNLRRIVKNYGKICIVIALLLGIAAAADTNDNRRVMYIWPAAGIAFTGILFQLLTYFECDSAVRNTNNLREAMASLSMFSQTNQMTDLLLQEQKNPESYQELQEEKSFQPANLP